MRAERYGHVLSVSLLDCGLAIIVPFRSITGRLKEISLVILAELSDLAVA